MSLDAHTLATLAAMPDRLEAAFRLVPRSHHHWRPASWDAIPGEQFSAVGQVCHLRDIEVDGYHVRIARMLAEEDPSLVSVDGYDLAERRGYRVTDPEQALASFRSAREVTLRRLQGLTDEQLARRGTFAEYGSLTLHSLVFYLESHDLQHLACMGWLLGKIAADARRRS